jgi:hypothetical protein
MSAAEHGELSLREVHGARGVEDDVEADGHEAVGGADGDSGEAELENVRE